jgi:hypothetical protein
VQIQTNVISVLDKEKWEMFVGDHINCTVSQMPVMFKFYNYVKNYKPSIFIVKNQSDEIEGVLMAVLIKESLGVMGYLSSRVLVFSGPLIKHNIVNKHEVLKALLKELVQKLKNKSVFIQFRNFFEWNDNVYYWGK